MSVWNKISRNCSVSLLAYVAILQLIFFYVGYYKFFPGASLFLIDYRHAIDFPDYWNKDVPYYSILPFDTLICIIFKYINSLGMNYLLLLIGLAYIHSAYCFSRLFSNNTSALLRAILVVVLASPNLIGVFTGHFAVLYTIAVYYCGAAIVKNKGVVIYILSLVIVCLKFNFMPLLLAPHLYQSRNIFRLSVIKVIFSQILLFLLVQTLCFYVISYFFPEYSLQKILSAFTAYKNDYVQGLGGFDFRYWLGSLGKTMTYLFGLSPERGFLVVVCSYLFFSVAGVILCFKKSRVLSTFIFILLVLYLNLATTYYWYTILLPFLVYFVLRCRHFQLEIFLLMIVLFPKPMFFDNYTVHDNFVVYLTIFSYLLWRLFELGAASKDAPA